MKLEFLVLSLIVIITFPAECRYLERQTPPSHWENSWSSDIIADDTLPEDYNTEEESVYDSGLMVKPKRAFSFWVKGSPATWQTKYSNKKDEFPHEYNGPRPYGLPLRWGR